MTNNHYHNNTVATTGVQQLSRTLDKVFEDTQLTGVLCLSYRNLRDLPNVAQKYDLSDTQNVGELQALIITAKNLRNESLKQVVKLLKKYNQTCNAGILSHKTRDHE